MHTDPMNPVGQVLEQPAQRHRLEDSCHEASCKKDNPEEMIWRSCGVIVNESSMFFDWGVPGRISETGTRLAEEGTSAFLLLMSVAVV